MHFLLPCLLCFLGFDKVNVVCLIFSFPSLTEAAMMESYIYTTTLLVAVIVLGFCSPDDTYHIKALSNETCDNAQPCITLSEFSQQNSTPAKNTTLKFLPGEHTLSTNISVADTNSYSLLGVLQNATTRIKCEKNIGFTFSDILYIRIHHLVFTSCGIHKIVGIRMLYNPPKTITQKFALFMDSILQIDIINSTFENNTGTALGVNNSRLTLDGNNSFLLRNCKCSSITRCICRGGGLYATKSTLMFRGYSSFTHNRATEGGGIYMRNSVLNVVGNMRFQQNKAYRFGGGIHAQNSSLRLCGNTSFEGNSALFLGGGMFAKSSYIYFCVESSTIFEENSGLNGGGVCFFGSVMKAHGYIILKNNIAHLLGGGIYVDSSNLYCTSKLVLGENIALFGGGIQADGSTLRFSGNNSFTNNLASLAGGGMFANCTHTILDGVSTVVNNKALHIYWWRILSLGF